MFNELDTNTEDYNRVAAMRCFKYQNRRASRTLSMLRASTGMIVEGSILEAMREQGFDLKPELHNKSVYTPNDVFKALGKYSSRPVLSPVKRAMDRAFDLTFKAFGKGSTYLREVEDPEVLRKALKLERASGAPEFESKGDSFEKDLARSGRIFRGECTPPPCVAYHRVQHGSEGPKVRLVWGYPASMTLLEARFARPLIDYFKHNRTPMAFAMWKMEVSARLIPIENSGVRYGIDFSGFDSSIHPKLIDMAFKVLKSHFQDTPDNRKHWDKIIHYFIHTTILMPDGYVYRKAHGVPSGSYFTQLIDSIVNYMAIQYMSILVFETEMDQRKILVLGDDSVFGTHKHVLLVRLAEVLRHLGLKLNVEKSVVTNRRQHVEFLGHSWVKGLMDRESVETAMRMAFPETHSSIEDPRVRIVSRVLAFAGDSLSAWKIIYAWSKYKGPYQYAVLARKIDSEQLPSLTRIVAHEREDSMVVDGTDVGYVGLLK